VDELVFDYLTARLNQLELVLHTSLFALIITTGTGVFVALYKRAKESSADGSREPRSKAPGDLVLVFGIIYGFLSAEYYFLLNHFYVTTLSVLEMAPIGAKKTVLGNLANLFRLPAFPLEMIGMNPQTFYLWIPASFPLLFSILTVVGIWYIVTTGVGTRRYACKRLCVALLIQAIVFCPIILFPTGHFITRLQGIHGQLQAQSTQTQRNDGVSAGNSGVMVRPRD
jgi:hypothetical protein